MSTTSDDLGTAGSSSKSGKSGKSDNGADNGSLQGARDVAGTVATAASGAVARLPDAAQTTRGAVEEANRAIRAGSDEMLTAGTTLSIGLALGLLIGGANRLLVILAVIPAAAMGFTLLDRSQGQKDRTKPLIEA
jgi:hypothetical protein